MSSNNELWLETVSAEKLPYVEKAMETWNKNADQYNQWSELGWDEKDKFLDQIIESSLFPPMNPFDYVNVDAAVKNIIAVWPK